MLSVSSIVMLGCSAEDGETNSETAASKRENNRNVAYKGQKSG